MAAARLLQMTAHGQPGLSAAYNDRVNLLDYYVAQPQGRSRYRAYHTSNGVTRRLSARRPTFDLSPRCGE